jgi:hypothetical protein
MKNPFTVVPNFLRSPNEFFNNVSQGEAVGTKAWALAISSVLFLMAFGFVTGLSHSFLQALSSAVKMPIMFVATIFFCLPAFYFFSLVLGTKLRLIQVTTVVLTAISVTAFLLLGLSPISLFFVLTSDNYPFFKLLTSFSVAASGAVGIYFLWRGMTLLDTSANGSTPKLRQPLIILWFILYGFVASQMAWRLRPFVGDKNSIFEFIRPASDNFYIGIIKTVTDLLGGPIPVQSLNTITIALICALPLLVTSFGIVSVFEKHTKRQASMPKAMQPDANLIG